MINSKDAYGSVSCESQRLTIIDDPDDEPVEIDPVNFSVATEQRSAGEYAVIVLIRNDDVLPSGDPTTWKLVASWPEIAEKVPDVKGTSTTVVPIDVAEKSSTAVELECRTW